MTFQKYHRLWKKTASRYVCHRNKPLRKPPVDALSYARTGDVLVVWKLDRLVRTMKELRRCLSLRLGNAI
ncbi:recombinase family protein [Sphingomonas aerolata]|uniref:recombinase family protein n=1 Tax=Sphingomonas aerolata TaxID=185951 RepID=UPI002FDF3E72